MITITDKAGEQLRVLLASRPETHPALHLAIAGVGPDGFIYKFRFLDAASAAEGDVRVETDGLTLYIDQHSVHKLEGATLDFGGLKGNSFRIDNPNPLWDSSIAQAVQDVIAEYINPGIAAHGGYVTLAGVHEGTVHITMNGGCQGCGAANVTLKLGIERLIRQMVPSVTEIVDVTEHEKGNNPYYHGQSHGASPLTSE